MGNANNGSFTVSEFCGKWGVSYFRDERSRGSDQGVREPSLEGAVARAREIAKVYGLPYSIIRTRTENGVWGVA